MPDNERCEHITGLTVKIAGLLNREKDTDALLALLLVVEFMMEEILKTDLPHVEVVSEFYDQLKLMTSSGCATLFEPLHLEN